MKKSIRLGIVGASCVGLAMSGAAAFSAVTITVDASTFANAITANATSTGAAPVVLSECEDDYLDGEAGRACPIGVATTSFAGFPTAGDTFGVLTSGNAAYADLPNDSDSTSFSYHNTTSEIGPDVYDEQTVRIELGPASGSCLAFDFRFLSEEFPEYVAEGYNDAFVAQLNTNSIRTDPNSQEIIAPGNFAAGAGDQVSVDGAGPSAMTEANAAGTTYDGATLPLVARTPVAPGSTNTLFLTVFDQGDAIYDSAVFLDNLRYENLPDGQCKSLALDPDEGTTSIVPAAPGTLTSAGVTLPLTCNLPPGPIGCQTTIAVMVDPTPSDSAPTGAARGDLTPTQIAGGTFTLPAGTTTQVTVPITAQGAAFLAQARALPGDLRASAKTELVKAKKLKKKAKKLATKAKRAHGKKAKKLTKKARKAKKKAKAATKRGKGLKARATALQGKPLGTATITFTNPRNGATSKSTMTVPR